LRVEAPAVGAFPTLLLFDIDGTLLGGASHAHGLALYEALRRVHGIEPTAVAAPVDPAGRTDGEIARLLALAAGVSAQRIDERAPAVREECCRLYDQLCPQDLSDTVLPGVGALLETLGRRDDVRLALLTGNFEPVARRKLRAAGLIGHFPADQGAFGSDSEDRTALPAIARRRAGPRGHPHPRERTIVIGDTPRDVLCARADSLRCVAIATGAYPASQLAGADAVAADARALGELLDELLSAPSASDGAGR
jgi:phosphoglycolate phosphatase